MKFTQKYLLLLIFSLAFTDFCFGQKTKLLQKVADSLYLKGDYSNAQVYFDKLYLKDSTLNENTFKLGYCCYQLYQPQQAFRYFYKLSTDAKFKNDEVYYYCGLSLKKIGKYKEAKKYFDKCLKKSKKKNEILEKLSSHEIISCDTALAIQHRKLIQKNFLKDITTKLEDYKSFYNPVFFDTVIFASALKNGDSSLCEITVFNSKTLKKTNSSIINLITENIPPNCQITYIGPGFSDSTFFASISKSNIENSLLYQIKINSDNRILYNPLNKNINLENSSNIHPFPMQLLNTKKEIERYLVFSSNRPNGYGGFDLWSCKLYENNLFEDAINMGKIINTVGDELSPFYNTNNNELFFSSNYHPGLGGFDIFKSKKGLETWNTPLNLELPINSNANELYYRISKIKNNQVFVSNRNYVNQEVEISCCNKIYFLNDTSNIGNSEELRISKIENEKSINEQNLDLLKSFLPLNLYFDNDQPNPNSEKTTSEYSYDDLNSNYFKEKNKYILEQKKFKSSVELNNDIDSFFEDSVMGNLVNLNKYLNLLWQHLNNDNEVTLSFKGFASNLAKNDYNKNLASRRISSLENYFRKWENGKLFPYLENKKLKIEQLPIGEVSKGNEQKIMNKNFEIYSMKAALQRRIEITKIESK